jgi:hypothetical protein
MNLLRSQPLLACAACAAGLLVLAARAPAQPPSPGLSQPAVVTVPSPYWGYTYAPYVVRTPLDGVAAIIHAQGEFLVRAEDAYVRRQEGHLVRLQVRERMMEVRRKAMEQWEWERDFRLGALNREQKKYQQEQLEFNLNYATQAEILTATPLNSIYKKLKERPQLYAENSTPVSAQWLARINVSDGGRANVGMLKDDKVVWPRLFLRAGFSEHRDKIEDLLTRAKQLARAPVRDQDAMGAALDGLESAVRACETQLDQEIARTVGDPDCNPRHYMAGRKFLRTVIDATFALQNQDAAFYFKPPEGGTVAELVGYMKKNGLEFAPATPGGERAYRALHGALADEERRVRNLETPSQNR